MKTIFNKYFVNQRIMETVEKQCRNAVIDISYTIKVTNTLNMLQGFLHHLANNNKTLSELEYEKIVLFSLTWALAGIYEAIDRQYFHEYLVAKGAPIPQKKEQDTIFDYFV